MKKMKDNLQNYLALVLAACSILLPIFIVFAVLFALGIIGLSALFH